MANEKTTGTAGTLYRVNYTFAAPNGQLRAGGILIEAKTAQEAWDNAEKQLTAANVRHYKITNTKPY